MRTFSVVLIFMDQDGCQDQDLHVRNGDSWMEKAEKSVNIFPIKKTLLPLIPILSYGYARIYPVKSQCYVSKKTDLE